MRKQICMGLLTMTLLVSLAAMPASAQTNAKIVAHVPFDFYVGSKILPAGDYVVQQIGINGDLLEIRSAGVAVLTLSRGVAARGRQPKYARLTFRKYGDQHFLSAAWANARECRTLNESNRERRLRRELKMSAQTADAAQAEPQIVIVAASRDE